jgi:hypothetical protein
MSKWIQFVDRGVPSGKKTRIWSVHPIELSGASQLGEVRWFSPWRQYGFYPAANTVFERRCLRDIANFCEQQTHLHREKIREEKFANT